MENIFTLELPELPQPLSDRFEVISCIRHSDECSVYMLKEKRIRRQVLLKISSDPVIIQTLENEKRILDTIHEDSRSHLASTFPKALYLAHFQDTVYYIRTYINGKTLEDLCESNLEKPGLLEDQALDYVIHLTELLYFLHSLTPPVIHRDIKPQNVIVDNDGNCHFIDMGISRFFDHSMSHDTLVMGTKQMAPPEQFGFRQTDKRSDIYSLGVLMYYCITGEYTVSEEGLKKLREPTRRIIQKATMFDPDQRYGDAREMMQELLDARFHPYFHQKHPGISGHENIRPSFLSPSRSCSSKKRKLIRTASIIFLLALLAGLAFFLLHRTKRSYSFAEPLIEEAVCRQLGKPKGSITTDDLEQVTKLHIFGQHIYDDESEVWLHGSYPWFYDEAARETGLYLQTGTICSLEDIRHMPNLEVLCLYQQQITDISPLRGTEISCLGLGYNPLTDLSPLKNNSSIQELMIPGISLADPAALSTLSALTELNISDTDMDPLPFLEGTAIKELNLFQVPLTDYRQLKALPSLSVLKLDHMDTSVMEQLEGLSITELAFYYSEGFALSDITGLAALERLTFFGNEGPFLTGTEPFSLPRLKELTLSHVSLEDFHFLAELPSLNTLNIYNADCTGYEGMDFLPGLERIICTDEQKKAILELFPDLEPLMR